MHRAHRVVHRERTARAFLPTLSCTFHIFSGWQGRGGRGCRTLRYGRLTEEPSAPQGAQACGAVSNVSRFAVLNALVSRFGALLLGVPKPRK